MSFKKGDKIKFNTNVTDTFYKEEIQQYVSVGRFNVSRDRYRQCIDKVYEIEEIRECLNEDRGWCHIENKTCPKCADRIEFNSNETLIGTNWFFHTKTYETTEGCTCSTCGWNNVKHWTYTFSPQY